MPKQKPVNTDKQVADLKARPARYTVPVKDVPGLYVRVSTGGAKTFAVVARDPHGTQKWATLGGIELTLDPKAKGNARDKARAEIRRIKAGEESAATPDTFAEVAENWFRRHVQAKGLRSEGELRRQLDTYILPAWKARAFKAVKKSDVAALLDQVEDNNGPVQADRVLSTVRGIMRWQAARDDDYVCVVTGKLRRSDPKERRGERLLSDDEIRLIWRVAASFGTYGDMVRLGLLTGQRRDKIGSLRWADIDAEGRWTIATEVREKGNGEVLPLPALALGIVRRQKRLQSNPYVFPGRGESYYKGHPKAKPRLDEAIAKARAEAAGEALDLAKHALPAWDFHDLRRTARSLLARAGVSTEIAKRVLGHAEDAIQATYNRHSYVAERGAALEKLAGLVALILDPPAENVTPIQREAAQ